MTERLMLAVAASGKTAAYKSLTFEQAVTPAARAANVTETVYRHQIRPVITVGAEAMDKIFANEH